jgi:hypothetical protein
MALNWLLQNLQEISESGRSIEGFYVTFLVQSPGHEARPRLGQERSAPSHNKTTNGGRSGYPHRTRLQHLKDQDVVMHHCHESQASMDKRAHEEVHIV